MDVQEKSHMGCRPLRGCGGNLNIRLQLQICTAGASGDLNLESTCASDGFG